MMTKNHGLLFGILAVQLRKATPAHIVEVAGHWLADPTIALGTLLVQPGFISESDRAFLDALVQESIRVHDNDSDQALLALGGDDAIHAVFAGLPVVSETFHGAVTLQGVPIRETDQTPSEFAGITETPGRYRHVSEHGRGGMGRILLVFDEHLGRNIALKELLPGKTASTPDLPQTPVQASATMVSRFLQEARITGQLEHPSIVPVYELGRRQDGTLYYTMKLVRGQTFAESLKRADTLTKRLQYVAQYVGICQAIAYAHSRGVIHRDLKPNNVMIGEFGETVVLDWGIAKTARAIDAHQDELKRVLASLHGGAQLDSTETVYGKALGTPAYMPPEQALGELERVDARSDVYSLGAILYEVLTGKAPFAGDVQSILHQVIYDEPVAISIKEPNAPRELIAICQRAMHKDPTTRYANAGELAEDVQRFVSGALVEAYAYTATERLARWSRKHKAALTTAAIAVLVLIVTTALYVVQLQHTNTELAVSRANEIERRTEAELARNDAERQALLSDFRLIGELIANRQFTRANDLLWRIPTRDRQFEWGLFLNASNASLGAIEGYRFIRFSPDGKFIAALTNRGKITLFDAATRQPIRDFANAGGRLLSICWSADGKRLVVAGMSRLAYIFDVAQGAVVLKLTGHEGEVSAATFSEDGKYVTTASADGTTRVWDAETGAQLHLLHGMNNSPDIVYGGGNPMRVVTIGEGHGVNVWEPSSGTTLVEYTCIDAKVSQDGSRVVITDGTVLRLVNTSNGERIVSSEDKKSPLYRSAISPDNRWLASLSADGFVRVFDAENAGNMQWSEDSGEAAEDLTFSPDSRSLTLYTRKAQIASWDTFSGAELVKTANSADSIIDTQFSPDSRVMAFASRRDHTSFFSVREALVQRSIASHDGNQISSLQVPAGGKSAMTTSVDAIAKLIDLTTDREQTVFAMTPTKTEILFAFVDPSGTKAILPMDRAAILTVSTETGEILNAVYGLPSMINNASLLPNGTHLAYGFESGQIMIAPIDDLVAGKTIRECGGVPVALAGSPDGKSLAAADSDGTITVWDIETGKQIAQQSELGHDTSGVIFTPDSETLLISAKQGQLAFWAFRGTEPPRMAQGTQAIASVMALTPDGSRLIRVGGGDIGIWDPKLETELSKLTVPGGLTSGVSFAGGTDFGMLMATYSGVVRRLYAAPWSTTELASDTREAWQSRYQTYRNERTGQSIAATPSTHTIPMYLYITRPRLVRSIQSYLSSAETAPSDPTGDTYALSGPSELRRIGLLSEDHIEKIGEERITSETTFRAALARIVSDETAAAPFQSIELTRHGNRYRLSMVIVPESTDDREIVLPRETALKHYQTEQKTFSQSRDMIVSNGRQFAKDMGLPVSSSRTAIDGMWMLGSQSKDYKAFFDALNVAYGDRLIEIDGAPLIDIAQYEAFLNSLNDRLSKGEPVSFTLKIERGAFHTITRTVRTQ